MRVVVGTLHTNENEFDRCIESVRRQTLVTIDHVLIEGLNNHEAHDALYQAFMDRTHDAECFVKVDADMILHHDTLFAQICERLKARPELLNLRVAVHDYFTDKLIGSLHGYRNTVRWSRRGAHSFTDRDTITRSQIEQHWDPPLAPAAWHCPDPSPLQAFHFGVHKGVKVIDGIRLGWLGRAREHRNNIECVYAVHRRSGGRRRLEAMLGAELALVGEFGLEDLDFNNPRLAAEFAHYAERTDAELIRLVTRLRRDRWSWLGSSVWFGYRTNGLLGAAREGVRGFAGWCRGHRRR